MGRKLITQAFPFMLPLRKAQRRFCFYAKMFFDKNRYAIVKAREALPVCIYESRTQLFNLNTGFDIKYQENKVFNLRLAAEPINNILICPGEVFSFWRLAGAADKNVRYREGLSVENGRLVTAAGGGLCHLSNFLFWMFLHTPLRIIERHPHRIKDFPSPDISEPDGVDATVSEGWLDLKVKNETAMTFQIELVFNEPYLYGRVLADQGIVYRYDILNRNKQFFENAGKTYERVSLYRQKIDLKTEQVQSEILLHTDVFEIGYPIPEGIDVSKNKGAIA